MLSTATIFEWKPLRKSFQTKLINTKTSTDFFFERSCDYYLFKFKQINKNQESGALFYANENKVNWSREWGPRLWPRTLTFLCSRNSFWKEEWMNRFTDCSVKKNPVKRNLDWNYWSNAIYIRESRKLKLFFIKTNKNVFIDE